MTLIITLPILDVALLNTGDQFTFYKEGIGSIWDLAFISNRLFWPVSWEVCEEYPNSDHQTIIFMIKKDGNKANNPRDTSMEIGPPLQCNVRTHSAIANP